MIKVTYDGDLGITMTGHAGQAPIGQDLVCAASSTLITALAEQMARNADKLIIFEHLLESGGAYVKVVPDSDFRSRCEGVYSVILTGFELLSQAYPDYILLESCI